MLGDLKNGRTVHSLSRLLSLFDVRLNYVSPEILRLPPDLVEELSAKKVSQNVYTTLEPVIPETDVLYVTRVQKERFEDLDEYEKVKGAFVITPKTLEKAKDAMIVMHPLPRVGEISLELDADPRAAYFRQMEYGLYVRMALLAMVLGKA
jgi:aspartate carbamoyltransferase catalytic subunit